MIVFVFPPRKVNSRGPMIWNHQLLEFAGYETEDGSILGDPMSAALTKAIIGLGWKPPNPKSRWDVLPLVVMADNDVPVMIEIPANLRELIKIRHPRFNDEFEKLDLRWVAFPALTRLGFDIGGVQYTAAPFAGWFMDAEIGVRDLADTFRYNALPDVAKALGLLDGKIEDGAESLEDLPEYERLSILTRAQTELTYAAYWSYQQAKVSMSDTLTASMKWCRYDDEFKAKNGFRLPADPYWLAPPQGSIIPVWHRGGAPNYQPKPMICRHVQDPLKTWEREKQDCFVAAKPLNFVANIHPKRPSLQGRRITSDSITRTWETRHMREATELVGERRSLKPVDGTRRQSLTGDEPDSKDTATSERLSVSIHFCSAGTLAEKIATKLHYRLSDLAKSISSISVCSRIEVLNNFRASAMSPSNLSLIVVSSTGQGEVPANGSQFVTMCNELAGDQLANPSTRFRYAILGNGDSRYAATYNGAAVIVERSLRKIGGLAMAGGLYHGDTAIQATPLQVLGPWWVKLQPSIHDLATDSPKLRRIRSGEAIGQGQAFEPANTQAEAKQRLGIRVKQLLSEFQTASVVNVSPSPREGYQGTYLITLDNKNIPYEDMGCVQLLPINSPAKVRTALRALGVNGSTKISLQLPDMEDPSYSTFLTEYIDLELPFQDIEWLKSPDITTNTAISEEKLKSLSSLDSLSYLHTLAILPTDTTLTESICLALALLHPRTYSTASSLSYQSPAPTEISQHKPPTLSQTHLDLLVKPLPNGRFSHTFLSHPTPTPLRYRLLPSHAASLLSLPPTTPLLILATGAGFAPVRCLLQRRIAAAHTSPAAISLFLGLKPADVPLFADILNEAAAAGVLDSLCVVGSNEERVRVYDRLREEGIRERVRAMVGEGGWVFVCMSPEAARGTRGVFEEVVGEGGVKGMGERWVEEVF
jgi:nitric oxide synthase oxygenase domain/subunit/sulfite reductase alpha subunit-like flavoprotein